jgi:hypothetical protein
MNDDSCQGFYQGVNSSLSRVVFPAPPGFFINHPENGLSFIS